jgi:Arc/MetJ-type ribon-helix-helix transcriptional regulator
LTDRQIQVLTVRGYGSFSDVVRTSVDRTYREEMAMETKRITELAEGIYGEVYGDIDNKKFHSRRVSEITDWLIDGEPLEGDETVAELAKQWRSEHVGDSDIVESLGADNWIQVELEYGASSLRDIQHSINNMFPNEEGNDDLAVLIYEMM